MERRYQHATKLGRGFRSAIQWLKRYPELPGSGSSPIFILSAGWRTGSTALQRLLNSGHEVFIWGEAMEISLFLHKMASSLTALAMKPLPMSFLPQQRALLPGDLDVALTTRWVANLTPPLADLKRAHWAFLEAFLGAPAAAVGRPRWGLKMVRATADVALYLRWLYPKAKIIFLYRNPYDSYRSYVSTSKQGWYLEYPTHRVKSVASFVVHWRLCVESFLAHHSELNAFLVSYESLSDRPVIDSLQEYLDFEVDSSVLDVHVDLPRDPPRDLSKIECMSIRFLAGPTARRLDYSGPRVREARAKASPSAAI